MLHKVMRVARGSQITATGRPSYPQKEWSNDLSVHQHLTWCLGLLDYTLFSLLNAPSASDWGFDFRVCARMIRIISSLIQIFPTYFKSQHSKSFQLSRVCTQLWHRDQTPPHAYTHIQLFITTYIFARYQIPSAPLYLDLTTPKKAEKNSKLSSARISSSQLMFRPSSEGLQTLGKHQFFRSTQIPVPGNGGSRLSRFKSNSTNPRKFYDQSDSGLVWKFVIPGVYRKIFNTGDLSEILTYRGFIKKISIPGVYPQNFPIPGVYRIQPWHFAGLSLDP